MLLVRHNVGKKYGHRAWLCKCWCIFWWHRMILLIVNILWFASQEGVVSLVYACFVCALILILKLTINVTYVANHWLLDMVYHRWCPLRTTATVWRPTCASAIIQTSTNWWRWSWARPRRTLCASLTTATFTRTSGQRSAYARRKRVDSSVKSPRLSITATRTASYCETSNCANSSSKIQTGACCC